jgi:hypothetical protein
LGFNFFIGQGGGAIFIPFILKLVAAFYAQALIRIEIIIRRARSMSHSVFRLSCGGHRIWGRDRY